MKTYTQEIDSVSQLAFKKLAECCLQFLYSPSVDLRLGSSCLLVYCVSIQIGKKEFVVVTNEWADTPKEYHNYYFLKARIEDRPRDVAVYNSSDGSEWTYKMDHFSMCIGAVTNVKSVEILSDKYEGTKEAVEYDAGVLVNLEDQKRILILREESISGLLNVVTDSEEIREIVSDLEVRLAYGA